MSSATCMPHSSPQLFGEGAWERVEGGGWRVKGVEEGGGKRVEGGGRKESGGGRREEGRGRKESGGGGGGGVSSFFQEFFLNLHAICGIYWLKLHLSFYIVHPPFLPLNLTNLQTGEMSFTLLSFP